MLFLWSKNIFKTAFEFLNNKQISFLLPLLETVAVMFYTVQELEKIYNSGASNETSF